MRTMADRDRGRASSGRGALATNGNVNGNHLQESADFTAVRERVTASLEDGKAREIVFIDLTGKTDIADGMIIASGTSRRHVASLSEKLVEKIKHETRRPVSVEGLEASEWVLLDAGDLIIHIFQPQIRDFYNLEKLWSASRPENEAVYHL